MLYRSNFSGQLAWFIRFHPPSVPQPLLPRALTAFPSACDRQRVASGLRRYQQTNSAQDYYVKANFRARFIANHRSIVRKIVLRCSNRRASSRRCRSREHPSVKTRLFGQTIRSSWMGMNRLKIDNLSHFKRVSYSSHLVFLHVRRRFCFTCNP